MVSRIVLFGATGYTGRLTAAALVARGADPVLAARHRGRAEALADELAGAGPRPAVAEADVQRPETVRALVERGDVLVSTVGPFARWGSAALAAAVDAGALALEAGGPAVTRLDVGYFVTGSAGPGSLSGGTLASAAGVLGAPGYAWRGGRLVEEMPARHHRTYRVHGVPRPGLSVAGSEHLALPRLAPGLRDVHVHLGWFGPAARPMQLLSQLTRLPGVPGLVQSVGARLLPGSTGGPDEAARRRVASHVQAVASGPDGRELARVQLDGPNPYTLTGDLLAWAATRARDGGLTGTGALGPVEAFGLDELVAGAATGGLRQAPAAG